MQALKAEHEAAKKPVEALRIAAEEAAVKKVAEEEAKKVVKEKAK